MYLRHFGHLLDHLDSNPATSWESIQVPATHHVVHVVPCDFSRPGPSPGVFLGLPMAMAQVLSKLHFLKAAARLGFAKESKELWKALDKDDSGGLEVDGC